MWLKTFNVQPKVVDREHGECGGAMISKLPNATWPKGSFVETNKVYSTMASAPEVIEILAKHIPFPLFDDNRNWNFYVIYRAGQRRRPGLRVRHLSPKTQNRLW